MRVKFGIIIRNCESATHIDGSQWITLNTKNGSYAVDIKTKEIAEEIFRNLLIYGYADFTDYDYNN